MANLLIGLLSLALTICYSPQSRKKTDLEHEQLKGRVKSVEVRLAMISSKSGVLRESNSEFLRSFKYDAKGMLLEKVFVEDKMKVRHLYSYDSNGGRIASAISNNGAKHLSWFFQHDSAGNMVEEKEFNDGAVVSTTSYKYDANHNRIEETVNGLNMRLRKRVYSYDDKGNIQELIMYMDSTIIKKESYKYEFDSAGNWIKRIASVSEHNSGKARSEPVTVTYRTITYY